MEAIIFHSNYKDFAINLYISSLHYQDLTVTREFDVNFFYSSIFLIVYLNLLLILQYNHIHFYFYFVYISKLKAIIHQFL